MAEAPLEAEEAGTVPPVDAEPYYESDQPPASNRGSGPIVLREHYLIDPGVPLPKLDSPSAKAFAVEDRRDLGRKLFGLICTPGLPTRLDALELLKDNFVSGIIPLVEWDVVDWPLLGEKTMVVIYETPLGGRVIEQLARKAVKITEYDISHRIVEPVCRGLQTLFEMGYSHRAIRPNNIFFLDAEMTEVVLGDFMTSPPGYDQPLMYEPIERAMASPAGRGEGAPRDDIFALGATIVPIILGHNPVARMKADDLIRSRLEHGSYTTLCGNSRIPLPLMEPLRALLHDDPRMRWDFNQITDWLTGQKAHPPQKSTDAKAKSSFTFKNVDHFKRRTIAWHLAKYPSDAAKVVRTDEFLNWIRRDFDDSNLAEIIKGLVGNAEFHKDDYQGSDEYLVSRIVMRLDPAAPIYFKNIAFMPDGYGPLLTVELLRKGDPSIPVAALNCDLHTNWFTNQATPFPKTPEWTRSFAQLKGYMGIQEMGFGMERAIYEANFGLPCQSPLLSKDYVVEIEQLLLALDDAASRVENHIPPMDRHIAGFIAAHFDEEIHPHLKALSSPKPETSVIGMLSLLAFLQWKIKMKSVLGLASWVGGLLGPAINTYHNRLTRRSIESEIPQLVRQGSLPGLFDLIDNAEKRRIDVDEFAEAKAQWMAAEAEVRDIEGSGEERLTKAERSGQQAAAMFSIVLSLIVITILTLFEFI